MDLKQLKDLLKVLRDKGVLEFEANGIKLKLSEDIPESKYKRKQTELDDVAEETELTDEELLYYSAMPPVTEPEQQQ